MHHYFGGVFHHFTVARLAGFAWYQLATSGVSVRRNVFSYASTSASLALQAFVPRIANAPDAAFTWLRNSVPGARVDTEVRAAIGHGRTVSILTALPGRVVISGVDGVRASINKFRQRYSQPLLRLLPRQLLQSVVILSAIGAALSLTGYLGVMMAACDNAESDHLQPGIDAETSQELGIIIAQTKALNAANGGSPGVPIMWADMKSGIHGTFIPLLAKEAADICRGYDASYTLTGRPVSGIVTACRQENGSWAFQSESSAGSR
jgi:surface antigen